MSTGVKTSTKHHITQSKSNRGFESLPLRQSHKTTVNIASCSLHRGFHFSESESQSEWKRQYRSFRSLFPRFLAVSSGMEVGEESRAGGAHEGSRWVCSSLRSRLPSGYPHWPRWGREARQPLLLFHRKQRGTRRHLRATHPRARDSIAGHCEWLAWDVVEHDARCALPVAVHRVPRTTDLAEPRARFRRRPVKRSARRTPWRSFLPDSTA